MQIDRVNDLYKLSPVQQDRLAESLSAQSRGSQTRQAIYTLHGQLDHSLFRLAWEQVMSRHSILRTAFYSEGLEKPLQLVEPSSPLTLAEQDWRSLSKDDQEQRLREFLSDDRHQGFNLSRAPLMRLSLLRLSGEVHQFILSYHDLVLDQASVGLVSDEGFAFYGSLCKGENSFDEKAPGSFKEYISWLRQQDSSAAEMFWQDTLTDSESPSALDGFQAWTNRDVSCKQQRTQLSIPASSALQSFARNYRLDITSLLVGAWALLLWRYNDEEHGVLGLMFSGRPSNLPGVDSIAGPFSNTLPARFQVLPEQRLSSWLANLNKWYLEAKQYQHVGPRDLKYSSKPEPGPSLSETVVGEVFAAGIFQPRLSSNGLGIDRLDPFRQSHPLVITALEGPQFSLCISYDEERFTDAFIGRTLDQVKMLLETMIAEPEQRLADISLLTAAERQQLIAECDNHSNGYSRVECVHELFEAQSESTPHATAITFCGQSLSYLQLNERANRLAHHLLARGVGPEAPVGVCLHRSLETVVALLGILKAGGAYLPLDPELPSERLSAVLEEARVPVLLIEQDQLFTLPPIAAAAEVICLDSEWETIARQSSDNPAQPAVAAQLAYIIYTSGSTGRPKGVCISHAAASSHLRSIKESFGLQATDRVLQFASLSFDVSLEQILAPLLAGATVVLRPPEVWNGREFWEQLVDHQLTVVNLPPAYWNQVTQELPEQEPGTEAEPAAPQQSLFTRARRLLRLMVVGADVIPPEAVRRWQRSCFGGVRLLNAYGPTETSITSTLYEVAATATENDAHTLRRVPIGRGVGRRRLYVLDRKGQLAMVGGRGELNIGGVELARGYFNDAALTAERFVPDPFSNEDGGRMYRSGDVVRRLPSGDLEYMGRRDGQVKLRGYRVELGEVEAALGAEPGVKECAVALKELEGGEKRLIGYVVLGNDETQQPWEIRGRLKERLPEHMIPVVIVPLERLPFTASGKVDRRALPLPDQSRPELETVFVGPRNETEEILVKIWTDLLGINSMGVSDSFFEVGGDSLLATQLISRVQKTFQTEVSLRTLFDEPTIAGLARNIDESCSAERALAPTIEPRTGRENPPLSFAQERLWFMSQLKTQSQLFNISAALRLHGELDLRSLEQAFSEIMRRHEALRTTLPIGEDGPFQLIHPAQPLAIGVTDLSGLPEVETNAEVSRLIQEEALHVFDLGQLPLIRVSLLRLCVSEHVLILTMHHIVSDGWSVGVMVREVATLYEAYAAENPSPLPELPVQYADFASWQRRWLKDEVLENHLDYWRRQLGGNLPQLKLPIDQDRPSTPSFKGTTLVCAISSGLSERLRDLSQREGATLFMTLMAAFKILLHHYTGQDDIIVGTDIANRNHVEIEGLIGFFVNLLPIRTNLAGNPTFREFLARVKDVMLGAYAHQDLPFARLVTELQPERSLNRAPIFQTLFVMQNAPMPPMKLAKLQLKQMDLDEGLAKFDLAVFMEETEQGLIGRWNYSTEIFEAGTIGRLAANLNRLLESIVEQPEAKLSALEMLSDTEKVHQAIELQQYQEFRLGRLRNASRKPIQPVKRVVKTSYLPQCDGLPLVIEPAIDDVDLVDWARQERDFIESQLIKHGALLFRNFQVESVLQFERCASTLCSELFAEYGDLPREQMGGKVYGSTPYPAKETILFHNESSHQHRWPMKIWFYCVKAATKGGETPLVDCRRVYKLLPATIRDRFAAKGVMYVRNFTEGLDVSWADFFHTKRKEEVERQCAESGIELEWQTNNGLQTRKATLAVARHPKTGEMVFFNQLQLHHPSCLEPAVRESLLHMFGEERLPRNIYYGDGTRIEDDVMAAVGETYKQAMVCFTWQEGDILMLDNMLAAHGRNPFEGERKIVVALGELFEAKALQQSSAHALHASLF